jgi:predicted nucleotidyltransferase component of viral defense system
MYLHNDKPLFEEVVSATANEIGLPIAIIEKDYYVTMILSELSKKAPECVFKGGTSLSKCHHVIDRFSEDIDIAFSDELGRGARKQFKENVVIKISEELEMPIPNLDDIWSKADYQCYILNYSPIDGYVPESMFPGVKLEVVLRSKAFPTEKAMVDSYIYQFLMKENMDIIEEYGLEPFEMNVQSLERTFIDKVFALCDYYMDDDLKLHSRHIFDIYMLLPKMNFNEEFVQLIKDVREHRRQMGRCPSSAPDVSIPYLLSQIIENKVYECDYEDITSYFQKTKIEYNEAIKAIQKIIEAKVF